MNEAFEGKLGGHSTILLCNMAGGTRTGRHSTNFLTFEHPLDHTEKSNPVNATDFVSEDGSAGSESERGGGWATRLLRRVNIDQEKGV